MLQGVVNHWAASQGIGRAMAWTFGDLWAESNVECLHRPIDQSESQQVMISELTHDEGPLPGAFLISGLGTAAFCPESVNHPGCLSTHSWESSASNCRRDRLKAVQASI